MAELNLSEIENELLDDRIKGIPGRVDPFPLAHIGARGWNVLREDLPLPLLVIKRSALECNIDLMRRYCERNDLLLAPHGKTTMAPQLFSKQLEAGAWGMTAASVEQLQVYRHFGVNRVLFANQLVGRANLKFVIEELNSNQGFEFFCFVDSPAGVELLAGAAAEFGLRSSFRVLVEVGYQGGRAGARSVESLDEILIAMDRSAGQITLAGVSGFEGLLPVQRFATGDEDTEGVSIEAYLESMAKAVVHLRGSGRLDDGFIVTAGGSAAFDKVVEILKPAANDGGRLMIRSGCYITHDHGMYAKMSPLKETLRPALELWTYVQSRPEPELSLLTFGRRDAPFDNGLPVPLRILRPDGSAGEEIDQSQIVGLNDQHAYLKHSSQSRIQVGDRVVCGISHPCTAFDKWKLMPVVDDDYNVVDAIRTYF